MLRFLQREAQANPELNPLLALQVLLGHADLRRIPTLYPGEQQLPTGPGEEPPSQPSIPGLEPDLPALTEAQQLERLGQQRLLED